MDKKSVLITGCSAGGIGFHLAKEYHTKGLRVFATARRLSSMTELKELGIQCLELDVTKIDSIRSARDRVSELTGGKLDILVNNAGAMYALPFTDQNMDEVRALFETNVFGVMTITQEFINLLIASEGLIVNIGSIAAIVPPVFSSTYAATKGALHSFANVLRQELAPFNVKVSIIVTGGVMSGMTGKREETIDLPPDSLYQPMNEDFKRSNVNRTDITPVDVYARSAVAATLKRHPSAWTWKGSMASLTWILDTFFTRTIWDYIVPKRFGLEKFSKEIKTQRKRV